jgi:hypothetical protein
MVILGNFPELLTIYLSFHRVPPNLTFELEDMEREWLYGSETFDFVHIRNMFIAIRDWPALAAQAYK